MLLGPMYHIPTLNIKVKVQGATHLTTQLQLNAVHDTKTELSISTQSGV